MTVIAVDGPAASGKGTLSRRLAQRLGFAYLDTGQLYRAVGLAVLRAGGDPDDPADAVAAAERLDLSLVDDPEIRSDRAAEAASRVAAVAAVRERLLGVQRAFAERPPGGAAGAILDGRDIGTVVCPGAEAKIFVTASVEARAERRHRELLGRGVASIYARVLQDLKTRDQRDAARATAPMKPAPDAFQLDTTAFDPDQVLEAALAFLRSRSIVADAP